MKSRPDMRDAEAGTPGDAKRLDRTNGVKRLCKVPMKSRIQAKALSLLLTALLPLSGAAQEADGAVPVDRWLVSRSFATAESARGIADSLAAATREEQFPQRGLTVAGTRWELVREDSAATLRLAPDTAGAFLAHAYIRSTFDRTVRLVSAPPSCGTVSAWLNGQRLADVTGDRGHLVRLAVGWNTLLTLVSAPDCPPVLGVTLRPVAADEAERRDRDGAAAVLRVQASRPPGVRRTHPAPWVTVEAEVAPESPGRVGEAGADLTLRLTAWGRSAAQPGEGEAEPDEEAMPEEAAEEAGEEEESEEIEAEDEEAREAPEPGQAPDVRRPRTRPADESPEARRRRLLERLAPPPEPLPPAPEAVEVDARAGGTRHRTTVQTPAPAVPVTLSFPLTERQLAEAARRGLRVNLRWPGGRRRVEMPWPGRSASADKLEQKLVASPAEGAPGAASR